MTGSVLHTHSEVETAEAGRLLAPMLAPNDVIALTGDLGAGKTALTKGIAEALGVPEPVVSPTFNIMLLHQGRLTLNHFDLYRLEDEAQLEDIDFYALLESGGVSLIEWGDRFPDALPPDHLTVDLHVVGDQERLVRLIPSGPRSAQLASAWAEAVGGDAS